MIAVGRAPRKGQVSLFKGVSGCIYDLCLGDLQGPSRDLYERIFFQVMRRVRLPVGQASLLC